MHDSDQNSFRAKQVAQLHTPAILRIEDNPVNELLVRQWFAQRRDLILLTAHDSYQGLKMVYVHKPAVILMEIDMPGLNGHAMLEILREKPETEHIPVIALSSNAYHPRQINEVLAAGFFGYLTNPFVPDVFMDAVDAALHFSAAHRHAP